jgi:Uma2 family endonuclease
MALMRTVLNEPPVEVQAWLAERRAKGQDLFDEVWQGTYHVAPAPHPAHGDLDHQAGVALHDPARAAGLRGSGPLNIGQPDDYRVPDQAYLGQRATTTFVDTAAIVVEIVSPRDETWHKLDFYIDRGVEELLIVDATRQSVTWFRRGGGGFVEADSSGLLRMSAAGLAAQLEWPPIG